MECFQYWYMLSRNMIIVHFSNDGSSIICSAPVLEPNHTLDSLKDESRVRIGAAISKVGS